MLPPDQAQYAIGSLGCAVVVAMMAGPLQAVKTVIAEKSTKSLPFPMAVMTCINASLWFSFGFAVIQDPFVWGPNALGMASGVTQIALFAKYGLPPKQQDSESNCPGRKEALCNAQVSQFVMALSRSMPE